MLVRLVILIGASYTPTAWLAQPDTVASTCAYSTLHHIGIEGGVRSETRPREGPERGLSTREAEAAVSIAEDDRGGRLDCTVLFGVSRQSDTRCLMYEVSNIPYSHMA